MSNIVSSHAATANQTWPFIVVPNYETFAQTHRQQSGAETLAIWNRVTPDTAEPYLEYVEDNYQTWIKNGHMIQAGNLNRLNPDTSFYHPYITQRTSEGFVEDSRSRTEYWPSWLFSPPPSSYGAVNFNLPSMPFFTKLFDELVRLKNETLVSSVQPYQVVPLAMTQEEHDAMHSRLKDSSAQHPHSFFYHPIHEVPEDTESRVVAAMSGGVAWDRSLRNLLPTGVAGIHVVIQNSCQQAYTYDIIGGDGKPSRPT